LYGRPTGSPVTGSRDGAGRAAGLRPGYRVWTFVAAQPPRPAAGGPRGWGFVIASPSV